MIYVDWSKLLFILLLLYFPLRIIISLALNYWQKLWEREVEVCLTKKLLNYADKNKGLMIKKSAEKVYIINKVVPEFSRQFISIPVGLFGVFVDLSFVTFNLYFLISSYHLSQLIPLLVIFVLVNLVWFAFFYYFLSSSRRANQKIKSNYQDSERSQVKVWLENLQFADKSKTWKRLFKSLDNNSRQINNLNFLSVLYQLPELIISGISILFLFLYYQFYYGGEGGLDWGIYFIANNLQTFFSKVKKWFKLLSAISSWQENYRKIGSFFS